jgi:transcriptional regulator with XRE-family HTH domain
MAYQKRMGMKNPQLTSAIRQFIKEKDLTQTEFAHKTGLSVPYINDLYQGRNGSRVTVETEKKLKRVMGKSFFLHSVSGTPENSVEV